MDSDWWVAAASPFGWYYFDAGIMNWRYAGDSYTDLSFTYQGPLFNLNPFEVLKMSDLPVGTYIFYFAVDTIMNGILDLDIGKLFFDFVVVEINEGTCPESVLPVSRYYDPDGGSDYVFVVASDGCNWTASSSDPSWLNITSGNNGTGDGPVSYSVLPNTGSSRTATITIVGDTSMAITVTQDDENSATIPAVRDIPVIAGQPETINFEYDLPAGVRFIY